MSIENKEFNIIEVSVISNTGTRERKASWKEMVTMRDVAIEVVKANDKGLNFINFDRSSRGFIKISW